MSLFPAYAEQAKKEYVTSDEIKFIEETKFGDDWLQNASHTAKALDSDAATTSRDIPHETGSSSNLPEDIWSSDSDSSQSPPHKKSTSSHKPKDSHKSKDSYKSRRKHKKKSKKKHKEHRGSRETQDSHNIQPVEDDFIIDTKRTPQLLTVDRIYRPSAPKCYVKYHIRDGNRPFRKRKFKRYYKLQLDVNYDKSDDETQKITRRDLKEESKLKKGSTGKSFFQRVQFQKHQSQTHQSQTNQSQTNQSQTNQSHTDQKDPLEDEFQNTNVNQVLKKDIAFNRDENFEGFKQEEDMTRMTANYNRTLADDPTSIDTWIAYSRFQDTVFQFEKTYRKGSIAKGQRVTAERKLAILDKAISHNPDCEKLLRERLNIAVSVYPADELQSQLQKLVEKEQGNIILWQGYIESKQCSMSHCSTPKVLSLYTKCLTTLHKLRRTAKLESHILEEYILRMLYQCGLFMRQAGLFEQLWTLLRMYLELNLSQKNATNPNFSRANFNVPSLFDEKQLVELEDVILNSQLPIHELWLRIEKLRESCHWLPFVGTDNCEDPQRLVFADDVTELIHPITTPGNTFKLVTTILTLLKVPLLPCRHTTMSDLGLDYVPWALDSVETLLPIFLPLYPIDVGNDLLKYTQKLAVGPQYLKTLPCQEEYLDFVLTIMQGCANSLQGEEKMAIMIWWFRFIRLLVILEREETFKMTEGFKKKLKSRVKGVLKQDEFRNDPVVFQEYALFEYCSGREESTKKQEGTKKQESTMKGESTKKEESTKKQESTKKEVSTKKQESTKQGSAVNILLTTIELNYKHQNITSVAEEDRSTFCLVYRTLVEMFLGERNDVETNKRKALRCLLSLALGKSVNLDDSPESEEDSKDIQDSSLKFKHVYSSLMSENTTSKHPETVEHFLPNYFTNFIICYGWFLYLTEGAIKSGVCLESTLDALDEQNPDPSWRKEVIFEIYVTILYKQCLEKPGSGIFKILHDVLERAIHNYPNNIYLLTILLKEQTLNRSMSQQWWRMKSLLLKTGRALPILFLVLIFHEQMNEVETTQIDTFTGRNITADSNMKNRMLSLFKQITTNEMCTKRCGLVWRLYLQFLHVYFDLKKCRDTYYGAVEELPWLKALYIDAAIYIPGELAQIQDLLLEKELRIHVTPEELDILRD